MVTLNVPGILVESQSVTNIADIEFRKYEYREFIETGTTRLKSGNRIGVLTVFTFQKCF